MFIKEIEIHNLLPYENLVFTVPKDKKHILITGKNGSGKTILLKSIYDHILNIDLWGDKNIKIKYDSIDNTPIHLSYFSARRKIRFKDPKTIKKIHHEIGIKYTSEFLQHMLNLKYMACIAKEEGDLEKAKKINDFFINLEIYFSKIFETEFKVNFDYRNYLFTVKETGKSPYNIKDISTGYSAVLKILAELLLLQLLEYPDNEVLYEIVFIDEIEIHLHEDIQKRILPVLTDLFPNVQIIGTTYSKLITESFPQAVKYCLDDKEG
jgi:AAA15 family ATPase/GTPase